jgi:hypothetical protein
MAEHSVKTVLFQRHRHQSSRAAGPLQRPPHLGSPAGLERRDPRGRLLDHVQGVLRRAPRRCFDAKRNTPGKQNHVNEHLGRSLQNDRLHMNTCMFTC